MVNATLSFHLMVRRQIWLMNRLWWSLVWVSVSWILWFNGSFSHSIASLAISLSVPSSWSWSLSIIRLIPIIFMLMRLISWLRYSLQGFIKFCYLFADLGVGSSDINSSLANISNLNLSDQLEGNLLISHCHKAKPSTGISYWISYYLHISNSTKSFKMTSEFKFFQTIVQTTNKYLFSINTLHLKLFYLTTSSLFVNKSSIILSKCTSATGHHSTVISKLIEFVTTFEISRRFFLFESLGGVHIIIRIVIIK